RPKLLLSVWSEDVTGDTVAALKHQARLLLGAALERERAARMKAAAGRRIDRARHIALQHGARTPARGIGERHGGEQRPRIGVLASAVKLSGGGDLEVLATIPPRHAVADVLDHPQVMGDEQEGETELLLQIEQHVQDLRLDRYVERRNRLVGDDELGIHRE